MISVVVVVLYRGQLPPAPAAGFLIPGERRAAAGTAPFLPLLLKPIVQSLFLESIEILEHDLAVRQSVFETLHCLYSFFDQMTGVFGTHYTGFDLLIRGAGADTASAAALVQRIRPAATADQGSGIYIISQLGRQVFPFGFNTGLELFFIGCDYLTSPAIEPAV
jgi:hypothetical protein